MNTDKLVELFKTEVEKLEKEAYERGKRDAFEKSKEFYGALESVANIEQPVQPLSANQQRKGLIEQAREFVESQKNAMGTYEVKDPSSPLAPWHCNVEFIVNEEKRTVVALLRGFSIPTLYAKGIAKCHPDEVFNADIGKAIALARALEFDVPEEFLNAAQPDEVVVGMVVETYDFYGTHHATNSVDKVEVIRGRTCLSNEGKGLTGDSSYTSFDKSLGDKIINDTNAQY